MCSTTTTYNVLYVISQLKVNYLTKGKGARRIKMNIRFSTTQKNIKKECVGKTKIK
jgi:hypothetical protein